MCGIAAIFDYDGSLRTKPEELGRMLGQMQNRGPDGQGQRVGLSGLVSLGHRRLAIIDLSPAGAQPMSSDDGTVIVTFNGEIYNYRELRADLEAKGCRFRSHSDTEVLLHLYQLEGEAMTAKLRGMYAFAIWDDRKQALFLARDPFGIKPLYYANDGHTFRAASQIKALLASGGVSRTPEPAGHVGFFLWGHVPEPYTLCKQIRSLPAGCSMWVDRHGLHPPTRFRAIPQLLFEAQEAVGREDLTPQAVHEQLRGALVDSVAHHLIADVTVGVFLSSGLDSTTLAALAAERAGRLHTVTLGFEEYRGTRDDEVPLSEQVARHLNTEHKTVWVRREDFASHSERLLSSMDSPSIDGVNTYFVSYAARQAGLKVALSGLGGDELFGSYDSTKDVPRLVRTFRPFQHCPPLGMAFRAVAAPVLKHFTSPKYAGLLEYGGTYGGAYLLRRGMFMPWELPGLLDPDLVRAGWRELETFARLGATVSGLEGDRQRVCALESCWYMRNQLLRDTDWASMAHSVEVRVPLLDLPLWRAITPLLIANASISKTCMGRTPACPLPAEVLHRKKTGFSVPVRNWLAYNRVDAHLDRGYRGWAKFMYHKHIEA